MVPLAADHNLQDAIVRGLRRRDPDIDIVRLVEVGMADRTDPEVLEWAAGEGRVLVTQDRNTMIGYAVGRVKAGLPMAGVIVRGQRVTIGQAIDDLEVVASCGEPEDFRDKVIHLPL
jgi:predicted nuclease of predicted toxin-antitoxin system